MAVWRASPAETLGAAVAGLWLARRLHAGLPWLDRVPVPRPITGGLVLAVAVAGARAAGVTVEVDAVLRDLLVLAAFASIGMGASVAMLRRGGPQMAVCLALAAVLGLFQNVIGIGFAKAVGMNPLIGVVAGSLTLTGGPATALAFAPEFERRGLADAATLGVAAGMFGVLMAGLIGGAVGAYWIRRYGLRSEAGEGAAGAAVEETGAGGWVATLAWLAAAMALGALLARGFEAAGIKLPATISAMTMGAVLRMASDARRRPLFGAAAVAEAGHWALSVFIVMALLSIRLWVLADLAAPLLALLALQVVVTAAVSWWACFRLFGRDYEAAVATAGFCGFMIGTTPNAMACMESLTERRGPAPRAYAMIPVVGGFLIDFVNSFLILMSADFALKL